MENGKLVTRRNDVGNKVLTAVISAMVVAIMGMTISIAGQANEKANINCVALKALEIAQQFTKEYTYAAINEIKSDIKEIKKAVIK